MVRHSWGTRLDLPAARHHERDAYCASNLMCGAWVLASKVFLKALLDGLADNLIYRATLRLRSTASGGPRLSGAQPQLPWLRFAPH